MPKASRQPARSARCSSRMASRSRLRAAWPGRRVFPLGLFARVVDLERQNGEPVDDQAGRLGVQRGLRVGQALGFEPVQQGAVQFFGQVVAALVGPVDAPLHRGQFGVGDAGGAGFVLNVPELEVGAMLAGDRSGANLRQSASHRLLARCAVARRGVGV